MNDHKTSAQTSNMMFYKSAYDLPRSIINKPSQLIFSYSKKFQQKLSDQQNLQVKWKII